MDKLQQRLLAAVAALAVVTLAGMAVLWPPSFAPSDPGPDPESLLSGVVVSIEVYDAGTDDFLGTSGRSAIIEVEVTEGEPLGEVVTVDTLLEGLPDIEPGDEVRMVRSSFDTPDGVEVEYGIVDFERGAPLLWLVAIFVVVVVAVGGTHGVRSLVGLVLSLLVVTGFIVPAILAGSSPFAVAFFGALAVMLVTLPLAHGVNPMTGAAIVGTAVALGVTIVLGVLFIDQVHLTGFTSEEANLARFAIPDLDPKGLVLAGLIIAALGVLDDVTVSQASTVFALRGANPKLGWTQLFTRAMGVGRDHIASTVNTLVLAYAGASLALLVLFSTSGVAVAELVTSEVIAEEVVKTLVGSIGLISAVPLTTALAASLAVRTPAERLHGVHAHVHGHGHGLAGEGHAHTAAGRTPAAGEPVQDDPDYDSVIEYLKHGDEGPADRPPSGPV